MSTNSLFASREAVPVSHPLPSLADLHTDIHDAPSLIRLLLSPANHAGSWQGGAIVCPLDRITPDAIADLLTLDVATRPDVELNFGKEDLTGTLAVAFEQPNATWVQVLDSFFSLWRRSAFPANDSDRPQDLNEDEAQALEVLTTAHARLLKGSVDF